MKRSFFVPTAIACSTHAFLLFGFTPAEPAVPVKPRPAPPAEKKDYQMITLVEEPKPVADVPDQPLPALKSPVAPPRAPDRSVPLEDGSFVQKHVMGPFHPIDTVTTVPIGPFSPEGATPGVGGPGLFSDNNGPIYTAASLDAVPKARFQISPSYPYALKSAGISGEVVVEFLVDEQGRVRDPRIVSASHPEFEAPSLAAVSKWRFEPGMRKNMPVRFLMRVPLNFSVDQ
jgi:periplasmic protein TonB